MVKNANEDRSNTTTLANDNTLVITTLANTNYIVRMYVAFTSTSATPDFKWQIATTGTIASEARGNQIYTNGLDINTSPPTQVVFRDNGGTAATAANANTGTGWLQIWFTLLTGATTGTIAFQWAQGTSDATAMTVLRGSYMEYIAK